MPFVMGRFGSWFGPGGLLLGEYQQDLIENKKSDSMRLIYRQ